MKNKKEPLTLMSIASELVRLSEESEYLVGVLIEHEYLPPEVQSRLQDLEALLGANKSILRAMEVDIKLYTKSK